MIDFHLQPWINIKWCSQYLSQKATIYQVNIIWLSVQRKLLKFFCYIPDLAYYLLQSWGCPHCPSQWNYSYQRKFQAPIYLRNIKILKLQLPEIFLDFYCWNWIILQEKKGFLQFHFRPCKRAFWNCYTIKVWNGLKCVSGMWKQLIEFHLNSLIDIHDQILINWWHCVTWILTIRSVQKQRETSKTDLHRLETVRALL